MIVIVFGCFLFLTQALPTGAVVEAFASPTILPCPTVAIKRNILSTRLHSQSKRSSGTSPATTPNNNNNDINQLLTLCYASSLAYLPINSIPSSKYASKAPTTLKPILQVVEPKTESGATIFESDDSIIVAFRGSATPKNFATNLRFQLTPMPSSRFDTDARAHKGFQEAAEGLWERLEPHLVDGGKGSTCTNGKDLIFTGHSLGGGTAEICALYAATSSLGSGGGGSENSIISQLTTFGGPCIGDSSFARYVNTVALTGTAIQHMVHDADPILANNGPLWEQLGFERSGVTVKCDPFEAKVYSEFDTNDDVDSSYIPWNILDHCKYMGVFVGPRVI